MAYIPIISAGKDNNKRKGISIIVGLLVLVGMFIMMLAFFYSSEHYNSKLGSIRILLTIIIALAICGFFAIFMIVLIKSKNSRQEIITRYSHEHELQSQDYDYQVKPQKDSKRSYEMYCPYCGAKTTSDAIFCPNCGNKIE
ncbi:MAG: zinc ribbon domain-containing protein [Candidatus Odinarchaeota archaeon]